METPKELKIQIKEILESFNNNSKSLHAEALNQAILKHRNPDVIADGEPMFFNGKLDAKTVLIALNPGSKDDNWKPISYESYLNKYQNLWEEKLGSKFDNFDGKQAAFLHDFIDSGLNIPNEFWKEGQEIKKKATTEVLKNKLQLELIPYPSSQINFINNKDLVEKIWDHLQAHFIRNLEIIQASERKYIIFTSRVFNQLLEIAYKKGLIEEFQQGKEIALSGITRNRLYLNQVHYKYQGKNIKALIASSFGSRSLPNAFDKMRQYGKFCFEHYPK